MKAVKMTKKSVKSIVKALEEARELARAGAAQAANDSLAHITKDLELRWGPGFAQWVADGLSTTDPQ